MKEKMWRFLRNGQDILLEDRQRIEQRNAYGDDGELQHSYRFMSQHYDPMSQSYITQDDTETRYEYDPFLENEAIGTLWQKAKEVRIQSQQGLYAEQSQIAYHPENDTNTLLKQHIDRWEEELSQEDFEIKIRQLNETFHDLKGILEKVNVGEGVEQELSLRLFQLTEEPIALLDDSYDYSVKNALQIFLDALDISMIEGDQFTEEFSNIFIDIWGEPQTFEDIWDRLGLLEEQIFGRNNEESLFNWHHDGDMQNFLNRIASHEDGDMLIDLIATFHQEIKNLADDARVTETLEAQFFNFFHTGIGAAPEEFSTFLNIYQDIRSLLATILPPVDVILFFKKIWSSRLVFFT